MNYLIQDTKKIQKVVDTFLKDNDIPITPKVVLTDRCPRAQWVRERTVEYNRKTMECISIGEDYFLIEFNDKNWIDMNVANNPETILNTIIHECLHHLAYHKNLEFNDGEHDFEKLLFDYGANSNYEDFELEDMYEDFSDIDLNNRKNNFEKTKNKYLKLLL